ncbi:Uncharacterised protein [Enterobacter asburiae]|uniref:Uncharacterized protein n=1 Tax=Enterobacter asburiae TaxID=61645 RepID=A0A376FIZ5_ENTAS|nr:Uncharacterised protein [Enterobacter asburiae]
MACNAQRAKIAFQRFGNKRHLPYKNTGIAPNKAISI